MQQQDLLNIKQFLKIHRGDSIDTDSGPILGMDVDAATVFVTKNSLLVRLALVTLWLPFIK